MHEPPTHAGSSTDLVFTDHALKRMSRRAISRKAVQEVVENWNTRIPRADGCTEYVGSHEGRRIKVVVDHKSNPAHVVTTFPVEGGR